jgi:hypothetical protein
VPRVVASADALALPDAISGATNEAAIALENHGTADVILRASIGAPFLLAEDELALGAGATRTLVVIWVPDDYRAAAGELRLAGPLTDLALPVSGDVNPDADGDGALALGAGGDDCDDTSPASVPGALEICDGEDNDCDGGIDQGAVDARAWFPDADGDGWGTTAGAIDACAAPGDGWATRAGDCDDASDAVNPDIVESWYDGIDADCSGGSDYDRDGDGYDNEGTGGDDCQDEDPDVNPGATEIIGNGADDDCDGTTG